MQNKSILVKLTEKEKELIKNKAAIAGISVSEFIRRASLKECELCKPDTAVITDGEDKIHVHLALDKAAVEKIDRHARELGTSRALLIRRMIMEKQVITCTVKIDINDTFKEMTDVMNEFIRGNRTILRLVKDAAGVLPENDRDFIIRCVERANKSTQGILKNFSKLNILVKDAAKKEINSILKDKIKEH